MTECQICYNTIKDNAKRFVCRKCHLTICIPCFKETIERGLYVPTCCSCRIPLNYDDIINATSKTYFKTQYINHLANVQFKMLTEQTIQVLYPLIYKINQIRDLHLNKVDMRAADLYKRETSFETFPQKHFIYQHILIDFLDFISLYNIVEEPKNPNEISYDSVCNELSRLQSLVPNDIFKQFLEEHWSVDEHNVNVMDEINNLIDNNNPSNKKNVAKCESCKLGIIIDKSNKYICDVCKQNYCNKCLAKIDETSNHQCKQEDIESWEEIKKSTKLCPKCSSRIFRSEGCPQMFCTNCHTGFDWNTGKIINGNFHNPHRMEWLRNGGDDSVINTCDDISSIINRGKIKCFNNNNNESSKKIEIPYYDDLLRLLNYYNELNDEIRKYTREYDNHNKINYYNLLRWYYRNDELNIFTRINEVQYKTEIKSNERYKFKDSTILSIITPITDIIHDGILTIINICKDYEKNGDSENQDQNQIPQILSVNSNISSFPISNSSNQIKTEFDNTNIKIINLENDSTKPKCFKKIAQIFENMISEIIIFDNNLYSIEKVIDNQLPHFQFYTIPDIFTGYSIHLANSGFETNYQLYFILNELCIANDEWKRNYEQNMKEVEKYVDDINKRNPITKVNKSSTASDILKCKYLIEYYQSKLNLTNIIYTRYLTELQKVILINAIRNDFDFHLTYHERNERNRRRKTTKKVVNRVMPENLIDLDDELLFDEINEIDF